MSCTILFIPMQHIFIPSLDRRASGSTESGTRERLIMTNHTHKHHSITPSTTQQLAHPSILFLSHRPPIEHLRCTHVLPHFKHTNTCTHPSAHLLSKSRKKCGQFSKSLPRTLMRFPMAGDLDGKETTKCIQYAEPGNAHENTQHAHGEHSRL